MAHPAHPPYPGFGNIKGYYLLNNITPETLNSAPYAPWCLSQQWKGNGYINGDFVADNKALCIASNILRNNGQLLSDYWGLDLKYDEINSPLKEKFKELVCPQGTVKGVINILTSWALNAKIKTDLINWNVCDNNLDFTELSKYASYIVHADHYYPQAKKGRAIFSNAALCSAFFNMQKSDTIPNYKRKIEYQNYLAGIDDSDAAEFKDPKKIAIMAVNICVNGGQLKSDYDDDKSPDLRLPTKFKDDVVDFINKLNKKDIALKFIENIDKGTQLIGDNTAAVDHIIPKAHGGASDPRNVAVISAELNLQKSDKYIGGLEMKYQEEGPNWLYPDLKRFK